MPEQRLIEEIGMRLEYAMRVEVEENRQDETFGEREEDRGR